jgi:hypothetical protein
MQRSVQFEVVEADEALSSSVRALIARQMASALLKSAGISLCDEPACATYLVGCGFGSTSVSNLLDAARYLAWKTRDPGASPNAWHAAHGRHTAAQRATLHHCAIGLVE